MSLSAQNTLILYLLLGAQAVRMVSAARVSEEGEDGQALVDAPSGDGAKTPREQNYVFSPDVPHKRGAEAAVGSSPTDADLLLLKELAAANHYHKDPETGKALSGTGLRCLENFDVYHGKAKSPAGDLPYFVAVPKLKQRRAAPHQDANLDPRTLLVVTMGTHDMTGVLQDLKFTATEVKTLGGHLKRRIRLHAGVQQVALALLESDAPPGLVARFGCRSFCSLARILERQVSPSDDYKGPCFRRIMFVGHSLGGAVSAAAAYLLHEDAIPYDARPYWLQLKANSSDPAKLLKIQAVGFGAPAVFEESSFAAVMERHRRPCKIVSRDVDQWTLKKMLPATEERYGSGYEDWGWSHLPVINVGADDELAGTQLGSTLKSAKGLGEGKVRVRFEPHYYGWTDSCVSTLDKHLKHSASYAWLHEAAAAAPGTFSKRKVESSREYKNLKNLEDWPREGGANARELKVMWTSAFAQKWVYFRCENGWLQGYKWRKGDKRACRRTADFTDPWCVKKAEEGVYTEYSAHKVAYKMARKIRWVETKFARIGRPSIPRSCLELTQVVNEGDPIRSLTEDLLTYKHAGNVLRLGYESPEGHHGVSEHRFKTYEAMVHRALLERGIDVEPKQECYPISVTEKESSARYTDVLIEKFPDAPTMTWDLTSR